MFVLEGQQKLSPSRSYYSVDYMLSNHLTKQITIICR